MQKREFSPRSIGLDENCGACDDRLFIDFCEEVDRLASVQTVLQSAPAEIEAHHGLEEVFVHWG